MVSVVCRCSVYRVSKYLNSRVFFQGSSRSLTNRWYKSEVGNVLLYVVARLSSSDIVVGLRFSKREVSVRTVGKSGVDIEETLTRSDMVKTSVKSVFTAGEAVRVCSVIVS